MAGDERGGDAPRKRRRRRRRRGGGSDKRPKAPSLSTLSRLHGETPLPPISDEDAVSGAIFDPELAPGDWEDDDFEQPTGDLTTESVPEPAATEVELRADLPSNPADDPDPATAYLEETDEETEEADPSERRPSVRSVVGVKFFPAGKIYLFDAGDDTYADGDLVVVESDRGPRLGTVAVASVRKAQARSSLKRVLRRPSRGDRRNLEQHTGRADDALARARAIARQSRVPIKLFRAEYNLSGSRLFLYYTSDQKIDHRSLARRIAEETTGRVELRQAGVRDEAKMVGGIGSCGQTLCCSTWLPAFVPVSIRNAKDQGLVLNPAKVSGQCGRLKCCLVYEQALYAELRKGLPRLGKRVAARDGAEGRVVEVDVLHQRIRVSFPGGELRQLTAGEVEVLTPPQQQRRRDPKPKPPSSAE